MTIEEIQTALHAMSADLIERGNKSVETELSIKGGGRFSVYLNTNGGLNTSGGLGGKGYAFFYGDTPAECIAKAQAFIAALPDAKASIMQTYLGKLADAVDYGHENNIPAEYVDPVRITQKAMSDNLLAAPKVPA